MGFLLDGGATGPDVSEAGQVAYACAMAEKVRKGHETEDDWGPLDQHAAWNELDAIPGLLRVAAPQQNSDDNPFADLGWITARGIGGGSRDGLQQTLDATIKQCESSWRHTLLPRRHQVGGRAVQARSRCLGPVAKGRATHPL